MKKQNQTFIVNETQRVSLSNQISRNEEPKNKRLIISQEQCQTQYKEIDQRKNNQILQKEYDSKSLLYSNEFYSSLANQMLSRFAQLETASQAATAYPLFKMLRGIAKKFMFNELEIVFFLNTIESQKWRFDEDPLIAEFTKHFKKDFLSNQEIYNEDGYKKLLLFLVCCGYTIKSFFNEQNDQDLLLIGDHIQSHCSEDFKQFIEKWRQTYMNGILRTAPRVINKLFYKLMRIPRDGKQELQQDYNALVDQIIQISPPYSSVDQKQKKQENKKENTTDQQQQFSAQFLLPNTIFNHYSSEFVDQQREDIFHPEVKQEEGPTLITRSSNVWKKL